MMKRTKQIMTLLVIMVAVLNSASTAELGLPVTIDLEGEFVSIAYDAPRNLLYVSNKSLNQIEVISIANRSVLSPIPVGSLPNGLDITHDGNYLWTANNGGGNLSKVDLNTRTEILPRKSMPGAPFDVQIASDGFGLLQINAVHYEFHDETGEWGEQIGYARRVRTSQDHTKLAHPSYSTLRVYDATVGTWSDVVSLPGFGPNHWDWVRHVAVSNDGKWSMVCNAGGTLILDDNMTLYGTIPHANQALVIDPWNRQGYAVDGRRLEVIDLERTLAIETLTLPRSLIHELRNTLLINADGSELYELNANGITIIPTGLTGAAEPKLEILVPNGGETLIVGKTCTIEWESVGPTEDVLLLYSLNNGQYWMFLDIVQNTGSYQWQLPQIDSDQCLVSIWDADDLELGDLSDETFTIFQCQGPMVGDLNEDCYVNWQDFSIFASHWLECGNPLDPSCQTE